MNNILKIIEEATSRGEILNTVKVHPMHLTVPMVAELAKNGLTVIADIYMDPANASCCKLEDLIDKSEPTELVDSEVSSTDVLAALRNIRNTLDTLASEAGVRKLNIAVAKLWNMLMLHVLKQDCFGGSLAHADGTRGYQGHIKECVDCEWASECADEMSDRKNE